MLTTLLPQAKQNFPVSHDMQLPSVRPLSAKEKCKAMLYSFRHHLNGVSQQISAEGFWRGETPDGLDRLLMKSNFPLTKASILRNERTLLTRLVELSAFLVQLNSMTKAERLQFMSDACHQGTKKTERVAEALQQEQTQVQKRDGFITTILESLNLRPTSQKPQPGQKQRKRARR